MRKLGKGNAKTFDFSKQRELGEAGEAAFHAKYPALIPHPLGPKGVDFATPNGLWVELKCDSRRADETPNAFIEVWSNVSRKVPGGPWQAYGKGADYFVYRFACGHELWLPTELLLTRLKESEGEWESRMIKNAGWEAEGLLVDQFWLMSVVAVPPLANLSTSSSGTTAAGTETTKVPSSAKPGDE